MTIKISLEKLSGQVTPDFISPVNKKEYLIKKTKDGFYCNSNLNTKSQKIV